MQHEFNPEPPPTTRGDGSSFHPSVDVDRAINRLTSAQDNNPRAEAYLLFYCEQRAAGIYCYTSCPSRFEPWPGYQLCPGHGPGSAEEEILQGRAALIPSKVSSALQAQRDEAVKATLSKIRLTFRACVANRMRDEWTESSIHSEGPLMHLDAQDDLLGEHFRRQLRPQDMVAVSSCIGACSIVTVKRVSRKRFIGADSGTGKERSYPFVSVLGILTPTQRAQLHMAQSAVSVRKPAQKGGNEAQ